MKTKINISKLRLCEPEKVTYQNKKVRTTTQNIRSKIDRSIQLELDIRGQSADDGVHELDAFIDNAVMSGVNTVTVIHGKGTGILRKAVHKRLKQIKSVKSFRLGVYGEGEDGVTIVELK